MSMECYTEILHRSFRSRSFNPEVCLPQNQLCSILIWGESCKCIVQGCDGAPLQRWTVLVEKLKFSDANKQMKFQQHNTH